MHNTFLKLKTTYHKFDLWCNKAFDKFFTFFRKHLFLIAAIVLFGISLFIRICFIEYLSGDMAGFLLPWTNYLSDNGGFLALKDYPNFTTTLCDYPISYINLLAIVSYFPGNKIIGIKIISFIFEYLLALGAYFLLKEVTKSKIIPFIALIAFFFMPTGIINSALWGQCDAIYSCGAVWSLYFILKDKRNLAMIIIGFALSIKLHIVFFFPTIIYLWLNKKVKLRNMLWIPVIVFLTFIPGYIAGVPFSEPIKIYFTQMGKYTNANYGAANMYALLSFANMYRHINMGAGVVFGLAVIAITILFLFYYQVPATKKNAIYVATLFALITPFVLPHMHERYFYLADVFIIIYVLTMKRHYVLIVLMQFSSIMCYTHFLTGSYIFKFLGTDSVAVSALINLGIIITIIYDYKHLERKDFKNNLVMEN